MIKVEVNIWELSRRALEVLRDEYKAKAEDNFKAADTCDVGSDEWQRFQDKFDAATEVMDRVCEVLEQKYQIPQFDED